MSWAKVAAMSWAKVAAMSCAKVAKALPLYVGHDLNEDRSREVSAHLERCGPCRALEAGLRESRAWIEAGPRPPLDESDYSAVRRGVWRRIEAQEDAAGRRHLPRAGRLVLAGGLLAAALLAVSLSIRQRPRASRPADRLLTDSSAAPPAAEPLPVAENLPRPAQAEMITSSPRVHIRPAGPDAEQSAQSVVKIEFQTANPGVRIIWLLKKGGGVPSAAAGRRQEVS